MSPRGRCSTRGKAACEVVLAVSLLLLVLSGCTSIGDFGRCKTALVTDNIHAWVGQEAAASVGAPISLYNLTDEERTLRDLAFPLIEPPYDRQRWDAVVYEYGVKPESAAPIVDGRSRRLLSASASGRVSLDGRPLQQIDRRHPQRRGAHRSVLRRRAPRRRTRPAAPGEHELPSRSYPPDRANALARVGENIFTIAWVQIRWRSAAPAIVLRSIIWWLPSRRSRPREADVALEQLQQQIAANQTGADRRSSPRCRAISGRDRTPVVR